MVFITKIAIPFRIFKWDLYIFEKGWVLKTSICCLLSLCLMYSPRLYSNPISDPEKSPFSLPHDPERKRSVFWAPFASFLLPGFDQWWEGQPSAWAYSSVALGGIMYASHHLSLLKNEDSSVMANDDKDGNKDEEKNLALEKNHRVRSATLGQLLYQGSGGVSAYHAFRTAVKPRQPHGEYEFLKTEETPQDLLMAPFEFSYLTRKTTFIPLLIISGLSYLSLRSDPSDQDGGGEGVERDAFRSSDAWFAGAYSYNAGVHEEAMFRGWIMPMTHEWLQDGFWSNTATSVLFALAHLGNISRPVPQLLLGWHLGWVTQQNHWSLKEAIFIHTWWDVIAFSTLFHYKNAEKDKKMAFWLPGLQLTF